MTRMLVPVSPFAELERMVENFDKTFDALWGGSWAGHNFTGATLAPVDIVERDDTLYVTASVPGVRPENLEVTVDNGVLTISGEIKQAIEENEGAKVFRREMRYGRFTRSFQLPENLNLDKIDATFDNGFVTISIPKVVEARPEPKKVPVKKATK